MCLKFIVHDRETTFLEKYLAPLISCPLSSGPINNRQGKRNGAPGDGRRARLQSSCFSGVDCGSPFPAFWALRPSRPLRSPSVAHPFSTQQLAFVGCHKSARHRRRYDAIMCIRARKLLLSPSSNNYSFLLFFSMFYRHRVFSYRFSFYLFSIICLRYSNFGNEQTFARPSSENNLGIRRN